MCILVDFLSILSLREKGLGTEAMQLFIATLLKIKVFTLLNVFDNNPIARGLYTKLGFEVVAIVEGERKNTKW